MKYSIYFGILKVQGTTIREYYFFICKAVLKTIKIQPYFFLCRAVALSWIRVTTSGLNEQGVRGFKSCRASAMYWALIIFLHLLIGRTRYRTLHSFHNLNLSMREILRFCLICFPIWCEIIHSDSVYKFKQISEFYYVGI